MTQTDTVENRLSVSSDTRHLAFTHTHTHTCPACVCWRSVLYLNMNLNMNLFTAALSELPLCVCVCVCVVHSVRATFTAPAHTITTLPWFLCFIYTHTHINLTVTCGNAHFDPVGWTVAVRHVTLWICTFVGVWCVSVCLCVSVWVCVGCSYASVSHPCSLCTRVREQICLQSIIHSRSTYCSTAVGTPSTNAGIDWQLASCCVTSEFRENFRAVSLTSQNLESSGKPALFSAAV